jgi:aryl-alcohol dehydrogenase-like predicted oxidoreductase
MSDSRTSAIPQRTLGKTGRSVTTFGLGGEGVLRTIGRWAEAVRVIERALELGVNYFDTAPAYAQSMDYLGSVISAHRQQIFLACKTADRSRDGSRRVLEDALRRLRVDSLDLWQLHDIRTQSDVERIFAPNGAIHALTEAQREGIVKYLGVTAHHDPAVLLDAMSRFEFDTVLMPLNCADVHRLSFQRRVLPVAVENGMGVIAMKVYSGGLLTRSEAPANAELALRYALSQECVSTAIIGCRTPQEVESNARIASSFEPLSVEDQQFLEDAHRDGNWTPYKRSDLIAPEAIAL